MKHVRQSITVKILLLMLSFTCGLFSAYESYYLLKYIYQNSLPISSLVETEQFGTLYLTNLENASFLCPLLLVICLISAFLFLTCVGHKKNVKGIYLTWFDRIYLEFALILIFIFLWLPCIFLMSKLSPNELFMDSNLETRAILAYLSVYSIGYFGLILTITTLVKRGKSHTFIKKTAILKFIRMLYRFIHNWNQMLIMNFHAGMYLLITTLLFFISWLGAFLLMYENRLRYLFTTILLIILYVTSICKTYFDLNKTIIGTKKIVKGNLDVYIATKTMAQPVKKLADDINNIRDSLSNALTGEVPLHIERIDLVELVQQAILEYKKRLLDYKLDPLLDVTKENLYVLADGRCTYRIIENLLSNAVNYALFGTRIYMHLSTTESHALFEIKNISATKLGINSDELGIGLGISIAKSLATLQHGSIKLFIDGDLFKAILSLPLSH